jgi:ADP-heptose:LPS heptosyltransferase
MVKFLVIRFSSIGDIVLTTPLLRMLKTQVEDSEIHYLVKPAFHSILEANPYIHKIHSLSDNLNETVKHLREENFDYVLDLQHNLRSLSVKRALKRMYFTVNKLNFKKWILVNLKINRLPDIHIVDRYMETVKLFDIKNDKRGLDYFIPENERVSVTEFPPDFRKGYVVLVLGAKHQTKKMPLEKISEVLSLLDAPVILVGGKEDRPDGEKLIDGLKTKRLINGCGQWSVNGSASVIAQSLCVISHDTGMMHIAAAFKKKIITIWGNTIPDFGMYAYAPDPESRNFEVHGLKCRPCSKLGKNSCPKKHFRCMMDQDSQAIASLANSFSDK